ncbi:DNA topoisomerase VI subunit B [Candidatus Woesearchaeota archaeon]|nr:DNA topoisomerase VI subunit B [Candidatus Woesearchaeota archaeon]
MGEDGKLADYAAEQRQENDARKQKAVEMSAKQRDISVAEFFEKNRHLLGFDNKRKALLTTVKEAVDNSLDACEEAGILPEILVEIVDMENDRFRIIVEDNGPGIVKKQIPNIFAKLLYGSKFHSLRQSLTADQPVLVEKEGSVALEPIGTLVDRFCPGEGDEDISGKGWRVPCFDRENYAYAFKPVSKVIKHRRAHEIIEVKTRYGKSIKVTGCHSLFSLDPQTLEVKEVAARKLKEGDYVIAPKKLPEPEQKSDINILEALPPQALKKQWWYVYGEREAIKSLFARATTVHKKKSGDKSRKYYRFTKGKERIDILDDTYKQYVTKGFIPARLARTFSSALDQAFFEQARIRSHHHGKTYEVPIIWPLTSELMAFLGLFVAEGHTDSRQVGLTFGRHEKELVAKVQSFALSHGLSMTLEDRPEKNSLRVKLFGGIISTLLREWCGQRAENKRIPSFVFSASNELRQTFIDHLYLGDGHSAKGSNSLMHSTVSKRLADELNYLWLLQGVHAAQYQKPGGTLGKTSKPSFVTSVYGEDINQSNLFSTSKRTQQPINDQFISKWLARNGLGSSREHAEAYLRLFLMLERSASYPLISEMMRQEKPGYKLRHLQEQDIITRSGTMFMLTKKGLLLQQQVRNLSTFAQSDLTLLEVTDTVVCDEGDEWVYDLSVPGAENFVGGTGGIACHNSRGQQGIGISASVMYGQLTTGRPARITSRIAGDPAHYYELKLNTQKNQPEVLADQVKEWTGKEHGTRIEIDLEASYQKGWQSVDEYLKQTAIVNPHVTLIYTNPKAEQFIFPRAIESLPELPKEIKPHPYGVELGMLMKMLQWTETRTLKSFLKEDFSRVGSKAADEILGNARLSPDAKPRKLGREEAEKLIAGIRETKLMMPPTDCISPIGEEALVKGLKKEVNAEFYAACARPPAVYRGNPFVIEAAIAYGGNQHAEGPVTIMRFANKVPLLYQQGACAVTESIAKTTWKSYGLQQSGSNIPQGPATLLVHMASGWVPFTSEAKEALAHYPEIIKETKLALQEVGRKLSRYTSKKRKVSDELKKRSYIEKYIPHLAAALKELLSLSDAEESMLEEELKSLLEKHRGEVEDVEFDPSKNVEYDEEFASIGREEEEVEE